MTVPGTSMDYALTLDSVVKRFGTFTAVGGAVNELRGDRVGWARLKTPSQWWKRHAETDQTLMRFLHANTSLNLDPVWRVADVEQLDEMCDFPLLFSQGVDTVQSESGRANIAEYIRRGGFLLIDACIDNRVTPDPDVFLAHQRALLSVNRPSRSEPRQHRQQTKSNGHWSPSATTCGGCRAAA